MADYIKKRTHIINHVRFLKAGAVGRDLYDWGMLWSGQQETDGEIPMDALLVSPWGAGGKRNVVVATKLIEVGLWERTDTGYRVLKWAEQGNATKLQLVTTREVWRKKKAARRLPVVAAPEDSSDQTSASNDEKPPCPPGSLQGSPAGIPTYTSPSTSLSGSDLQGDARGSRALKPDEPLTDQRRADFESLTLNVPARDIEPEWRHFVDDRITKTMLFGSAGAIDADWRKWVRRQNEFSAEKRKNQRGRADTRQPLRDIEGATWLKPTGTNDL